MHAIAIRHVILIAGCLAAAPALAGVAGTSSGVTSTIGTQGTNTSPDVQQQSAGFVQQNQQLQAGQNGVSPTGIVLPGGVANAAAASTAKGAPNSANPGDPGSAQPATPATPPPPPPPPPTYVSVVKHLSPSQEAADAATNDTAMPVAAVTPPLMPVPATTDPAPVPAKAAAAVTPPAPVTSAPANAAANAAKIGATERTAEAGVVSGGRGPAPDGYTFYVGFGIALVLLVIALGAYLSSQKDEAARGARR
jgi:hypothetical protein